MSEEEIRIIIADDHPIVRRGLRQVIEGDARLKVLAEADDGEQALAMIQELKPQVAVLDVDMPRMDGFAAARQIKEKNITVEIIFLTMHSEEDLFNQAMDLGAKGFILKDSAVTDVISAIKAVTAGKYFVTQSLTTYLLNRANRSERTVKPTSRLDELTPTERKVLKMIADYKTSKEIADDLYVSTRTIDNHRANICQKLNISGNNALIKFVAEHKKEI